MKFCPKCNSLMTPRRINGKSVLKCVKCGYEIDANAGGKKDVVTTKVQHAESEKILVIDEEVPERAQKVKGVVCPACKNDEAYFWILQTRSADEPATRFYKCTRCGKVWREYE
ncbi:MULTISPECIES: transcription factor S [Acidianus]|uniref:DNA-directed RNA polymerase subunit M n=1 Tax=Candidatus Acidianus copahuensis TaxID=1160895 RepID=A0A031LPD8_9CREN|nr:MULTISPECIES: transcription factor S [Acidianus]EZQ06947.1 DNA-directed RNA polymerase subunit M [Candidatus Acidianus copahuensis]NON62358.1 transcription factor S [Acidianus sp. RZ1]